MDRSADTRSDPAPSISVALCTRNGARFLEAQLRSIVAQSVLPGEIILSDDASDDETVRIARDLMDEFAETHPDCALSMVILENRPPLGVTANFERAISAARGDVIVLCDQDDVWHPDRLAEGLASLGDSDDVSLAFSDARLIDTNGDPLGLRLFETLEIDEDELVAIRGDDPFAVLIKRNIVTGATVVFRRRLLEMALPFPSSWVHDEWLATIAAATGRLGVSVSALIDYRQHASNEIGVRRATLATKIRRVLEPRAGRNDQLVRRSRALLERLSELGERVPANLESRAAVKLEVEMFRAALPPSRFCRVLPVLRAGRRGWYTAYCSQGSLDMIRDILQSHR
jgi:glycosyltransferase involved in cell wall biosynthesis